jgi:endonuclease/exonuclease/phosphatase (EEP) superfamily protein YafD
MTFNTQISNQNFNGIAAEVRRINPDVVLLVEFGADKRSFYKILSQALPYSTVCRPGCQFEMLSKFPIDFVVYRHDPDEPSLIRVSLRSDFEELTLVGTHITRPPYIGDQFRQIRKLGEYLRSIEGPLIVMGDFNATPFSALLTDLEKRSGLIALTGIPSWPSYLDMPQLAIDHILASSQIRVLEKARIGRSAGSDHYPVSVTVAVPIEKSQRTESATTLLCRGAACL